MTKHKLFCEISPLTYKISVLKCKIIRHVKNIFQFRYFARSRSMNKLPVVVYSNESLIRRVLGNVDMQLQENKAVNLGIATKKVSGVIIKPGQIFSFWHLVGNCTKRKGYKEGLVIKKGQVSSAVGGGMCQFTNLLHWLVLHSPLEIIEHHHHDGLDLFPDYERKIPFGIGTSIMYNYLDYRFKNTTDATFQLIVYTTDKYLCGELRTDRTLPVKYHIKVENERFSKEGDTYYRNNKVYRESIYSESNAQIEYKLIKENHARVMYDM